MVERVDFRGYMLEGHGEANAGKVSLQDRLQKMAGQPFSLEETFTILGQLGQALCYAHQCNVTHGNLKPETILFNENGEVLLAEFFLHALAAQPGAATVSESSAYRAPELLPGQASKLGDQYALGCIAYEMVTGNKPFLVASVSTPDFFYRTKKPISPKHFNPTLSSASEEAILKAIEKEPTQRHRDISCFLAVLGSLTDSGEQATSVDAVPIPPVSEPPEQVVPPQAPVWYAIEEMETSSIPDVSTLAQTVYPAQTSGPVGEEESSPDHYSVANNLLTDVTAPNPANGWQTSAYARALSKNSAKFFFKWRWVGVVTTCVIAVCIVATSFLAITISHSTQEQTTIPAVGTKIDPTATPVPLTPTAEATPTPEQSPTIVPSPTPAITLPTPTPTQPVPTPRHHH